MKLSRIVLVPALLLVLAGCQSLPMPTPSPTATDGGGGGVADGGDVDVSGVTGAEPTLGLIDPCALISASELEAILGVDVTSVVRGEVKSDGSQLCAFVVDAEGSTHAALSGSPYLPDDGGLLSVVNGLKDGGAVVGVMLSAQDPDTDLGSDSGDAPPPQIQIKKVDLGKAGFVVATPNGGAAFAANPTNVLLTIMDLIAGPSNADQLTALISTAYARLEG